MSILMVRSMNGEVVNDYTKNGYYSMIILTILDYKNGCGYNGE